MKVLALDIETAPSLAYTWGLWQQNIGINQVEDSGYILCWSAKWIGEDEIHFDSIHKSGPKKMLRRIHKLLDKADAVLHYNGVKFDIPTLNKEFILYGFPPPSPYKQIDLYQVCKKSFRFLSNKLDYVSQALGIGSKVRHEGHELWTGCMKGDADAWRKMEEYNRQDVALLEPLYMRLRPWIDKHPSHGAFNGITCCPKCGSTHLQKRGSAVANQFTYSRYQCQSCGGWARSNKVLRKPTEAMVNVL